MAELSFGFWRYMLSRRHAPNVWVDMCSAGLPNFPHGTNRAAFAKPIEQIHKRRNRVAHLEPLVEFDEVSESQRLDRYDTHLATLARWIDPQAERWIASVSRVADIRSRRP